MRGVIAEKLFWFSGWVYDFSKIATILLAGGLLVHYFLFSVLIVRGESMEPNHSDGEVLLINKISYYISTPERGDVIAMYFPGETERRFIKRIIAIPGETIEIDAGQVFINGTELPEEYLPIDMETVPPLERLLGKGEYFVLGDNRNASSDSRAWGPVPESFIIGKIHSRLAELPSSQGVIN
jgi:signal peptidase I